MDLKNKNVIYVGGVGGIGVEVCKLLMLKNIKSLVVLDKYQNQDALDVIRATNSKIPVHFLIFDVTMDLEDMKKKFAEIIAKIERIDILINGAAILNEREIELTIDTNLIGVINTIVAAFDYMDKRNGGPGGVIVTISDKAGLNGFPSIPVYSATTAATVSFTETISQLVRLTGVTAFVFCSGIVRTPMVRNLKTFMGIDEGLSTRIANMDIMTPETVAKNCIKTIEACRNGSIWLLHLNELSAVKIPSYWDVPENLFKKM